MKKVEFCEECKEPLLKADIHHKDRDHSNNSSKNLQKLCKVCHGKLHGKDSADMENGTRLLDTFSEISDKRIGYRLTEGFKLLRD